MKLIREVLAESTTFTIEESVGKGKSYFIEGVFLQSNIKNRNGRVYPESVMDGEVKRYTEQYINTNRAYGELGHPESPSINLDRVSHMIVGLRKEGTNWIGKAKLTNTPMGDIARGLLDSGASLGVSSRALGSLKMNNEGVQIVQNDFMLSTAADIVADPSGPNCFVQGIMENAEWIYEASSNSWIMAEAIKREVKRSSAKMVAENQAKMFQDFLNSIK